MRVQLEIGMCAVVTHCTWDKQKREVNFNSEGGNIAWKDFFQARRMRSENIFKINRTFGTQPTGDIITSQAWPDTAHLSSTLKM